MKNPIRFFKIYNLKSLKRDKSYILLSIIVVSIAIAAILAIQLTTIYKDLYLHTNLKHLNGGDICIEGGNTSISDLQLKKLGSLKDEEKINYTTMYTNTIEFKTEGKYGYGILNCVNLNKSSTQYNNLSDKSNIILSNQLANRLNVKKGDKISISIPKLNIKEKSYNICEISHTVKVGILSGEDSEMAATILGEATINYESLISNSNKNIETLVNKILIDVPDESKINYIKKDLQKIFGNEYKVRTASDLEDKIKDTLYIENKALNLIGILTIIIGGIGISSSMLLLVVKRQKDFTILKIIGMKNRNLALFLICEAFVISIFANIIGIPLGLILTALMNKSVGTNISVLGNLSYAFNPILTTFVLSIVISAIFMIIPIIISRTIKPISIMREQYIDLSERIKMFLPILILIILIGLSLTLYTQSVVGIVYTVLFCMLGGIIYSALNKILELISKINIFKSSLIKIALRNLGRQRKRVSLSLVPLIFGLVFAGIILNITCNIIPMLTKGSGLGYNVSVSTKVENSVSIEKALETENNIKDYNKVLNSSVKLETINKKNTNELINNRMSTLSDNNRQQIRNMCTNVPIVGHFNTDDLKNPKLASGRWLNKNDKGTNNVVINSDWIINTFKVNVNDTIDVNIYGQRIELKIVGVMEKPLFGDAFNGINTTSNLIEKLIENNKTSSSDLSKSISLGYLLNVDVKQIDKIAQKLSAKLVDAEVVNMNSMFDSLNIFFKSQEITFIYVTVVCILATIFLISNINFMSFIQRNKELMIIRVLGANDKDILHITLIESLIIGIFAGLFSVIIYEGLSNILFKMIMHLSYHSNSYIGLGVALTSIFVSITTVFIVVPKTKIRNLFLLLRES